MKLHHFTKTIGASAVAMMALAGSALADGYGGSVKDAAPAAEGRTFSYSVNAALTSDYIFRGLSQSSENPAISAGLDVSYGILYAGFWGSSIDFDDPATASMEIDIYAGIKPVLGPVTFDFAALGYFYPGQKDSGPLVDEADYLELKAGASITPFTNATLGAAVYWSPDFGGGAIEDAVAVEGTAGYTFAAIGRFTPSISGVLGYQEGDIDVLGDPDADDSYTYWNVGLGIGFDKFTLDLRYWDTDLENANNFAVEQNADERFVATLKVVLP